VQKTIENQVLALAALSEAVTLADLIATYGECDQARLHTSLNSVFSLESESLEDIYGGRAALLTGLQGLITQFSNQGSTNIVVARYQMGLIHLQRKLMKNDSMLQDLRRGIQNVQNLREMTGELNQSVIGRLATTYQDTISTMQPQILIQGKPAYLSSSDHAERIRALLLAGIRASVLWQQSGGSRWSLLLGRRAYVATAKQLVESLK